MDSIHDWRRIILLCRAGQSNSDPNRSSIMNAEKKGGGWVGKMMTGWNSPGGKSCLGLWTILVHVMLRLDEADNGREEPGPTRSHAHQPFTCILIVLLNASAVLTSSSSSSSTDTNYHKPKQTREPQKKLKGGAGRGGVMRMS